MSTPTQERTGTSSGSRWLIPVAAVAALVVAVAAGISVFGGDDTPPVAAPLVLEAGEEDLMAMCIVFSAEELERVAEIAFEGTVTLVDGARVTLAIDHWFRGGDAATVVLNAPQGMEALIGGIPFDTGSRYLITAQDGTVNYCGFTGPSTPDLRAVFETAFAQG